MHWTETTMSDKPIEQLLGETGAKVADTIAVGSTFGALLGFLPHVVTVLSLVYICIRIYETKTVQEYLKRRFENGSK